MIVDYTDGSVSHYLYTHWRMKAIKLGNIHDNSTTGNIPELSYNNHLHNVSSIFMFCIKLTGSLVRINKRKK